MNSLIEKLQVIEQACGDKRNKKQILEDEKKLDDFTRLKKKISRDIKDVRQQIEERNQLLGTTSNNLATVKMSTSIRQKLKEIQKDTETLNNLQKTEQEKIEKKKMKGKEIDPKVEEGVKIKAEIVELCYKHIEECKNLERSGLGQTTINFEGSVKVDGSKPLLTELPDIDDEGFQLLRKTDMEIDQKLDQVGEGVQVLKNMATEMGKEVELQTVMISELDHKVDKVNVQLENLNKRLKKALTSVRKADRFIIDFILLVVLLALVGYIYNLSKKF
jgi:predicted  nucleic acid-binding Zn-ribbon protein